MTWLKKIVVAILFASISCIDPYTPNLSTYKTLLVVEGLISNENSSYKIRLGKTFNQRGAIPEMVTDAEVTVTDGNGTNTVLQNCGNGLYKTDSTSFRGVIGQRYTLEILTSDGQLYKSRECTMLPVPEIDKIYFEKGEEISGINDNLVTGLKIFLNTTSTSELPLHLRWTFDEVWKTVIPGVQKYTYERINQDTVTFHPVPYKEICWKESQSSAIIISSIALAKQNFIAGQEIQFIDPVASDRLSKQYSILVRQYSILNDEFEFWEKIKNIENTGGDIFASQPFPIINNIYNVNNASEMVLGYFEVSAVSQKRIFISQNDLHQYQFARYVDCPLIEVCPDDYPYVLPAKRPSWDEIYHQYIDNGYVFVEPKAKDGTVLDGMVLLSSLVKFVFSTKICSLCSVPGSTTKPEFWIDLN